MYLMNLMKGDVMKVLIAEDDKFCAMAIKSILEIAGYDVIPCHQRWWGMVSDGTPGILTEYFDIVNFSS